MILRVYKPADCKALTELFYETVHSVNTKDYTKEQVDAWADGNVDLEKWNQSFLEHYTVIAEEENGITGFGDISDTGYLDRVTELARKTRVPALEILPERETDAVFREETILWLRERGIKTWCNSLSLSKNLVYGAGYDDLKALRFGGDAGWGRLLRQGVDIIQTDWPYELWRYLKEGDSL